MSFTQPPDTFTSTPEDLVERGLSWEPSEHTPRETVNLLSDLALTLRKERGSRATSAEIIRQQNLAYGRLELEHKKIEAATGALEEAIGRAMVSLEKASQELVLMQAKHERYVQARGPLTRFAERLEEFFRFGRVRRLP